MAKIDTSGWKEFVIGDLFEKLNLGIKNPQFNKALDVSEEQTDEFNLPLVNAKHGNNGIMFYGRKEDFETASMTIDIVQNGAIATGDVYAQPQETGVLWDAYLIKPKHEIKSEYTLMFLAVVIERAIKERFSYDDKCVWDKASLLKVELPVDSHVCPDWAYMDSFMAEVMKESEACLENLRLADEKKTGVDISGWKDFEIGKLFDVVKGTRLTKANMREGSNRFIGSSAMCNGLTTQIANDEKLHPANTITVCYNGSVGETFYQDEPFWASDDVNVLYPNFDMSKNIGLFIAPLIRSIGQRYAFVDKWRLEIMKKDCIKLPIDDQGNPDWAYMDSYMRVVMQDAESSVEMLSKSLV